jgi:hypothetical protein
LNEGPFVSGTTLVLDKLPAALNRMRSDAPFEILLVVVPALCVAVIWVPIERDGKDLVLVIPPAPARFSDVVDEEELMRRLIELAKEHPRDDHDVPAKK